MRPTEFVTNDTYRFVVEHLPAAPARVLEVGCGHGHLAARLVSRGDQVVAIDASEESIAAARQLGVDARVASWPDFDGGPFDALVFARSLHHVHGLDAAVARAAELLVPGAALILDEFAYDAVPERATRWVYELASLLEASGELTAPEDGLAADVLASGGALDAWHARHPDDMHTADAMTSAVADHLDMIHAATVPYLFRYFAHMLEDTKAAGAIVARIAHLETERGTTDPAFLAGRRLVARKK